MTVQEQTFIVGTLLVQHADAKRNYRLLQEKLLQYRQNFEDFNRDLSFSLDTVDWSSAQKLLSESTVNELAQLAADLAAAEADLVQLGDRVNALGYEV